MIGPVLQFEDLQRICQPDPEKPPPRRGTVEAWAKRIGLPITYDSRGGVITTVDAFNRALGLGGPAANDGMIGADDL